MMTEEQKQELIKRIASIKISGNANRFEITELADIALTALTQPASPALKLPDGLNETTAKLVISFATALAEKLHLSEVKYGWSDAWKNPGWQDKCLADFNHHIGKGDPRDVAAYCAFMWFHGWTTSRLNAPHTAPIEPICSTGGAEWVKVSDGLPKRGQRVNAFYLNRLGKGRTISAEYIYSKTEEAGECDPDTQCVEYCEESDTYFVTEGWYEVMDNWEEYGSIAVTEGNITHWMPLPAAPEVN